MTSEQVAAIERLRELGPLVRLIYNYDARIGNLAITTSDGSNCLGFFEPYHSDACKNMINVIDSYNEALPLIEALQAERDALQAECETLRSGHDKTHQSIDRAIAQLSLEYNDRLFSEHYILGLKTEDIKRAVEILAGEGE